MTTGSRSQDRGWLEYDPSANGGPDHGNGDGAGDGASPAPDLEVTSPWLRHDAASDTTASDPDADPGTASRRDPAWLAPELEVPAQPASPEDAHDTGVPPTLAEEPADPGASHPAEPEPTPAPTSPESAPGAVPEATMVLPAAEMVEQTAPRTDRRGTDDDEEGAGPLAVAGAAVKEFAIVVGMALVLSFVVKTWLLQAFYIPSGSMEDTLVLNDRVIVSKLTPGPVDLKRGDIIVFADPGNWLEATPAVPHGKVVTVFREAMTFVGLLPDNSENHLIKRVIGLPGDHVVCCDEGGRITINGTAIKEPYLKPGDSASDQDFDITVPRGRVWVMGDHRSNSADSRAHDSPENNGTQGSVDERLIVGRAVALVWPLDHLTWLSNPTATFAHVPAPAPSGGAEPAQTPRGNPAPGTGGAEATDGEGGG
ncbi:signal peptidase I [Pedococcus sp. KACC 23699]|uniref:Signal peptidase I n=1 Tax=Pedococcus sp. KACC 23699 TaxID=3149228 RepID=A0AAU7JQY1_9MICO